MAPLQVRTDFLDDKAVVILFAFCNLVLPCAMMVFSLR